MPARGRKNPGGPGVENALFAGIRRGFANASAMLANGRPARRSGRYETSGRDVELADLDPR